MPYELNEMNDSDDLVEYAYEYEIQVNQVKKEQGKFWSATPTGF